MCQNEYLWNKGLRKIFTNNLIQGESKVNQTTIFQNMKKNIITCIVIFQKFKHSGTENHMHVKFYFPKEENVQYEL